ncbi:MAG: hypothetical protein JWR39_203 [Devosia sp.]|nr:hypothetical protein [Devosia sp.]
MLYLPDWATDYLKRADRGLGTPLALYERIKGGMRLAAVDREAVAAGLSPGQNLADARALVPSLHTRQIDRPLLEAAFADFADWHSNASPLVAVLPDQGLFGDLVLDVTGVSHLFGGEEAMLRALLGRLAGIGYRVQGAVASTVGAAWAVAHFAPNQVVAPADTEAILAPLPIGALRLSPLQIAGLNGMGLKQVGQVRGRERKALQARFGLSLLTRLDQAFGMLEERPVPRLPVAERYAERRFADPIGLMDDVLMCAHDLAVQIGLRLESEGLGAQSFHLFLYRVDHKVMCLSVNSARATREPAHIARLFAHRSERLGGDYDAGFGIDTIRLAAGSVSPLDAVQVGAFAAPDGAQDLDRLYDRMASRLGTLAVLRTKFSNTHIPERAVQLEPVIARTPDDPQAAPDPGRPRPLRLLPMPEPIAVTAAQVPDGPPAGMIWRRVGYQFIKASGPERLAAEWWRSGQRLQLVPPVKPDSKPGEVPPYLPQLPRFDPEAQTRDYFIAEDDGGRRFWLFRQGLYGGAAGPSWYLHGFFS